MKILSDGLLLLGRYGDFRCGSFVLAHGGHAALVETPPWRRARNPVNAARRFLRSRRHRHTLDRILLTHVHDDHARALGAFVAAFPGATVTLHRSQVEDAAFHWLVRPGLPRGATADLWDGAECRLDMGGEPLHLIHAPKHSLHDVMIVFRGVLISGDWWLGPGDPNPARVPLQVRRRSVERMMAFGERYRIHTVISAHANDIRRDVHFGRLMASTWPER